MATIEYSSIAELNDSTSLWKIKARLTRKWDVCNPYQPDQRWRIDFILLDKNGDHIHAKIAERFTCYFSRSLNEGDIYDIENFKVQELTEKETHRPVMNKFCISFLRETLMNPASDDDQLFPKNKFEFVPFSDIPSRSGMLTYTTDVVGNLKCLTDVTKVSAKQGKTALLDKRNLTLENERGATIDICLFAEKAHQITSDVAHVYQPPIILVITSTVVKQFLHKDTLSSTSATKVYINLDIDEVNVLKQSIGPGSRDIQFFKSPEKEENENDMYINRRTVVDTMNAFQCSTTPLQHTCIATIVEVEHETQFAWYYMACPDPKCKRSLDNTGLKAWCKNCKKEIDYPVPRYRLKIKIEDSTGSMKVVAFGNEAEHLLQIHVEELVAIYIQDKGSEKVQAILEKLIGYKRMFKIKSGESDSQRDSFILSGVFLVNPSLEQKHVLLSEAKVVTQKQLPSLKTEVASSSTKRKLEEVREICDEEMPKTYSSESDNFPPKKLQARQIKKE